VCVFEYNKLNFLIIICCFLRIAIIVHPQRSDLMWLGWMMHLWNCITKMLKKTYEQWLFYWQISKSSSSRRRRQKSLSVHFAPNLKLSNKKLVQNFLKKKPCVIAPRTLVTWCSWKGSWKIGAGGLRRKGPPPPPPPPVIGPWFRWQRQRQKRLVGWWRFENLFCNG